MTKTNQTLSFTMVDGYLKGDHRRPFELHATGCRDLRQLQLNQPSWEVLAATPAAALASELADMEGAFTAEHVQVQPCCSLVRMKAAGRAPADYNPNAGTEVPTPEVEALVVLTDAEPVAREVEIVLA